MAPKPKKGGSGPKSSKGSKGMKDSTRDGTADAGSSDAADAAEDEAAALDPMTKKRNEILSSLSYEGLPGRGSFEPIVQDLFKKNMDAVLAIFVYYAKHSSECETREKARMVHLGARAAFAPPVVHASLSPAPFPLRCCPIPAIG